MPNTARQSNLSDAGVVPHDEFLAARVEWNNPETETADLCLTGHEPCHTPGAGHL